MTIDFLFPHQFHELFLVSEFQLGMFLFVSGHNFVPRLCWNKESNMLSGHKTDKTENILICSGNLPTFSVEWQITQQYFDGSSRSKIYPLKWNQNYLSNVLPFIWTFIHFDFEPSQTFNFPYYILSKQESTRNYPVVV